MEIAPRANFSTRYISKWLPTSEIFSGIKFIMEIMVIFLSYKQQKKKIENEKAIAIII